MGLYEGTSGVLMFLIEIITIVWILYMAWGELREYINVLRSSDGDIVKSLGAHFGDRDVANALEFVSISLQITAFVVWWVYQFQYAFNFSPAKRYEVYYTTAQPQGNFLLPAKNRTLNVRDEGGLGENNTYTTPKKPFKPWELSDDSAGYEGLTEIVDEINTMSDMLVFYGFLQGVNLLLLMARVMKMLKFQPRLAIVTNTVAGAWLDLAHFGGIFMIFLAMMSVVAHIQFGDQVEETSTMLESFIVVFIMLLGGSTGTEFLQPNSVKSVIDEIALGIFYSFMPVFFVLLLLNFLLGILGDSFGDEKEALGEYEGDDLPTDFFKFVKYYSRRVDPRGSRYWPSHWTIRRAVKKAISAHQFNELSDSEKRAVEEEKAFKAAEVMAEKAAEEARRTGYGAAHGVLARALNVSTKALGLNSPLRSPHDRKSPKSPWRPGAMEKGGFDGGERLDDDFDLRSVHSSQANSDDDDASSELSAESEEEEQEQVVIIDGERMTREELIINLNRIHADYVGSIQQTDSAARKRRAVLGYSIEQFVDQLVEFEHEDEMDEDSPEAIQYLQEQAAAVKTERLEALNDQIEGYQESQEDAMAFNIAAVGWMQKADGRLTQIEDSLTLLCEVMEKKGAEIRGTRARFGKEGMSKEQRERLVDALAEARAERREIEEEQKKQKTLADMRSRLALGKGAAGGGGGGAKPKLWGALRAAVVEDAPKKMSMADVILQLKAEGRFGSEGSAGKASADSHSVASMFRRRRVERAQEKLKLVASLMAAKKNLSK